MCVSYANTLLYLFYLDEPFQSLAKMRKLQLPLVIAKEHPRSFQERRRLQHLRISHREWPIDLSRQTVRS